MKRIRILLLTILVVTFAGCSKDEKPSLSPDLASEQLAATTKSAKVAWVTTFAGNGQEDLVDGQGVNASFYGQQGIALDRSGNLYVADVGNERIRKITTSGLVSTPRLVNIDPQIRYDIPYQLTVDSRGSIYFTNWEQRSIRKVLPTGEISTIAYFREGYLDGPLSIASFTHPDAIVTDKGGNIFISDGAKIRKISTSGIVSTVAGAPTRGFRDGKGSKARFDTPNGLAMDSRGHLYVADGGNNRIRKISPGGEVTTVAGSGRAGSKDGSALSATFTDPNALACDRLGNIYICDFGNNKIRKLSPEGIVSTVAGSGEAGAKDGPGSQATFHGPIGIAVSDCGSFLYVSDWYNSKIRKITLKNRH